MANKFEDILERSGVLTYTNVGVSMLPLLREKRDVMIIEKATEDNFGALDAVLFRRPGVIGRGEYVLHRILKVNPDGTYFIIGDNCISGETVKKENILGVLTGIVRDGKRTDCSELTYRIYVNLWCRPYRFRIFVLRTKSLLRRILSKIKRTLIK